MEKINREFLDCINEYNKKTKNFQAIFKTYYDLFTEANKKQISDSKDQLIFKLNAEQYKNANVLKQVKNELEREKKELESKLQNNQSILELFKNLTKSNSEIPKISSQQNKSQVEKKRLLEEAFLKGVKSFKI